MTQEEKARRYDQALARAERLYQMTPDLSVKFNLRKIFPEIREKEIRIVKDRTRPIGQRFECDGLTYEVRKADHYCRGCACYLRRPGEEPECTKKYSFGLCGSFCRSDGKSVIFVKVENKTLQRQVSD